MKADVEPKMNEERKWHWPRWTYLVLSLIAGTIPTLHIWRLNEALERTRYSWGLMPGDALMLKWFGELAGWLAVMLLLAFLVSARFQWLRSERSVARISTATAGGLGIYAIWCACELWINLQR